MHKICVHQFVASSLPTAFDMIS